MIVVEGSTSRREVLLSERKGQRATPKTTTEKVEPKGSQRSQGSRVRVTRACKALPPARTGQVWCEAQTPRLGCERRTIGNARSDKRTPYAAPVTLSVRDSEDLNYQSNRSTLLPMATTVTPFPNRSQAQRLLVALFGSCPPATIADDYAFSVSHRHDYKPLSWLQAVHWIAAGGTISPQRLDKLTRPSKRH